MDRIRRKRSVRKFPALLLTGITCMALAFPVTAAADGDIPPGYGEVTFAFHVDSTLSGMEMCMYFMDTDTLDVRSVVTEDYKSGTVTAELPCGTYEFGYATFDGDLSFNYTAGMSCDTFTVTENGTTYDDGGDLAVVSVLMRVVVSVPIDCAFRVNGDYGCIVQLWLSGESDAVYAEGTSDIRQQEEYSLVATADDGSAVIDAGDYTVSGIRAYDAGREPLNVYYPAAVTVDRVSGLSSGQTYDLYVYDDAGLNALTESEQRDLWESGYRLMLSSDTPAYSPSYYDKKVISYDVAAGLSDGTEEMDIDVSGFTVESGDHAEADGLDGTGNRSHAVRNLVIVLAAIGGAVAAGAAYGSRKRNNG